MEKKNRSISQLFVSAKRITKLSFYCNVFQNGTVSYYISQGAIPEKLVLGIPVFGRSFTLANANETEIGANAQGPGDVGEITGEAGFLSFLEVLNIKLLTI